MSNESKFRRKVIADVERLGGSVDNMTVAGSSRYRLEFHDGRGRNHVVYHSVNLREGARGYKNFLATCKRKITTV